MEDEIKTFLLEETDPRYIDICKRIYKSNRALKGVLWIEEVINDSLFGRYLICKEDLELVCGDNLKELQLFHGTNPSCLRTIMKEGFKRSCNKRSIQGKGTYLAMDAETSLAYVVAEDPHVSFLFLCDVLIGREKVYAANMNFLEIEYFDCFTNSKDNPSVYVVPYDEAIYPRFVIALGKNDGDTATFSRDVVSYYKKALKRTLRSAR